ncbi:hypothetical protein AKJ52_02010 [candidate division MSBL1 archaeon SCGC-AAA382C18]|uniref:Uncharacterized protein n=1 Tax=candidate division MSBL1 archaeon SCGC-AAA382C18 TaxID=1698281 RepID=A0A133VJH5_9EURY|nr:hypothetical protein AKJ52_02010 [candidate division MSBL1 archaeon SCGC-AAA382C18]
MKQSRKYLIVTIVALVLLGGILGLTIKAELDESSESDRYRTIVDTFDSSLKSLKLDQAPTGDFSNIKSNYDNIILSEYENRSFDQDQELIELDNEIKNTLNNFSVFDFLT